MSATTAAHAADGMVASPHYLATAAGVEILRRGGTAADAIVAAAAVLAVAYPHMCSIGGDAFALVFNARTGQVTGLNGSGRSPATASLEEFRRRGLREIPLRGPLPITVPGVVDAWAELSRKHGRLPFSDLLAAAIAFARDGVPVTERLARAIATYADDLRASPAASRIFLADGVPPAGSILRQPDLARTLERIAAVPDSIYRGDLARELAGAGAAAGGLLTAEDLAEHHAEWVAPLEAAYRDLTVVEMPPNSGGIIALLILKLVENLGLESLEIHDHRRIDVLVRATRLAFATARHRITDPAFMSSPVEELLSESSIARLRASLGSTPARSAGGAVGDTVYLCAVDRDGLACSFIQSVYFPFGSTYVADGTGVLFQNRGAYFSLNAANTNVLAPRKRTYHTLMPAMALRGGRPWLVFGTMGADGQAQTQAQVLTAIVDLGLDPQAALDAPRWLAGRFLVGDPDDALTLERRFPPTTIEGLRTLGHRVRIVEGWSDVMGHAQAIRILDDAYVGGADRRGDGLAAGI